MPNKASKPIRIALLGAESTGKTSLSIAMTDALRDLGQAATTVPETLREWCLAHARTPDAREQIQIAKAQADAIFAIGTGWVIADTTSLMTAVYSDYFFQDQSLYEKTLAQQSQFDLTLVMGLDVAWVPDGFQRDGEHVRAPVDTLIRHAMDSARLPFKVIYGQGEARLKAALFAIQETLKVQLPLQMAWPQMKAAQGQREETQFGLNRGKTAWRCDLCSDSDCEHKLFSDLLK